MCRNEKEGEVDKLTSFFSMEVERADGRQKSKA